MRLQVGAVWDVNVPYSDDPTNRKYRPCVVVSWSRAGATEDAVILVVPITSFGGGGQPRTGDVSVRDWMSAGLNKQSWVRARRIWAADMVAFDRGKGQRGTLDAITLDEVMAVLEEVLAPPV